MITTYATKQCNERKRMIEHGIESTSVRRHKQHEHLHSIIYESDIKCIDKLHIDRRCFHNLCQLLTNASGFRNSTNVEVEEMIAMLLTIIAYHVKNRIIKFDFV